MDRSTDSLIRLPEVRRRTGLSTATIYRKMGRGEFPQTVRLSANIVGWYESDVGRWIAAPLAWRIDPARGLKLSEGDDVNG